MQIFKATLSILAFVTMYSFFIMGIDELFKTHAEAESVILFLAFHFAVLVTVLTTISAFCVILGKQEDAERKWREDNNLS